jgi:hypothetical protein
MKPNETFALVIRVIGLLGLAYVVRHLANNSIDGFQNCNAFYFVKKIIYLFVGLYLVRGAPCLVKFAYPDDKQGK